ncbi:MAG: SEL1-like repeat protein, partial [Neisseria subflava]|nr:SEL1-like repeat protein [Neisseria subflava]
MKNWLRKIAVALFGFGQMANTSDIPNFAETEQEAKQGNAASQFNLGLMYYLGKGATKDYKQAEHWFRRAAEQGDVEA